MEIKESFKLTKYAKKENLALFFKEFSLKKNINILLKKQVRSKNNKNSIELLKKIN